MSTLKLKTISLNVHPDLWFILQWFFFCQITCLFAKYGQDDKETKYLKSRFSKIDAIFAFDSSFSWPVYLPKLLFVCKKSGTSAGMSDCYGSWQLKLTP